MRIRIYGTPQNVSRREVCKALRYYAGVLMSPTVVETLSIRVDFGTYHGCKGEMEWIDRPERPRRFRIGIRASLSREMALESLAHEMVHVKQYATGQMRDYLNDPDFVRWEGEAWVSDTDTLDERYWFAPWEIEARGWERGLSKMFQLTLKK